jgi:hypothetical protein
MKKAKCREITFHYDPKTNLQLIWVIDSIPEKEINLENYLADKNQ